MSPSFHIKPAVISDKLQLLEIEAACFKQDKITSRQMHYLLSAAKAVTYVVEIKDKAVGYCLCLIPKLNKPARIYSLAVLPACQGQGLAYALLNYAVHELIELGYSKCRLEVACNNSSARKLYCSFGFYEIKALTGYYEDHSGGLRMEKRLCYNGSKITNG